MPTEERFDFERDGHTVPAIVWRPAGAETITPLLLVGHGGQGHKTDPFVLGFRDRLVSRGVAVAAIDAVGHGDRVEGAPSPEGVIAVIADAASYDTMVGDWTAALDTLLARGDVDQAAIAYAGLSGGTLFGLPYVTSDRRIVAAALGACGYLGAPLLADAPETFGPILRTAAARFDRPARFALQLGDDLFPPDGGRALYEDLASEDKSLIESPGTHTEVPIAVVDRLADWLWERLVASD